ncbi:hypothetical protein REPUB_Repub09cG0132500 [Reevesia pubescens]
MSNMHLKDIPSFIRTTDPDDIMFNFVMPVSENCLKSSAILFNTFDEFENEVFEALPAKSSHIYPIGPLTLVSRQIHESQSKSLNSSLWEEDTICVEWLNKWKPKSVVYVKYGSVTVMTDHHLREFAWGLAKKAICEGLPLICWPFFAEQQTNCRYECTKWGIGMKVNPDFKCEDVTAVVKEMMEGDNGKKMKMPWNGRRKLKLIQI